MPGDPLSIQLGDEVLSLCTDWLVAEEGGTRVPMHWLLCSGILALGASFRGLENGWRFRGSGLRVGLGAAGLMLGVWAGVCAIFGELAGVAWLGLCVVGTWESVLAKGLEQGGSDPMTLWLRAIVAGAAYAGSTGRPVWNAAGVGLLLASYLCAGVAKAKTRDWWNGRALAVYVAQPTYELCRPLALAVPDFGYRCLGLFVLGFELLAPGVLWSRSLLWGWVFVGVGFHLANTLVFGLHRFFWTWVAGYPLLFGL